MSKIEECSNVSLTVVTLDYVSVISSRLSMTLSTYTHYDYFLQNFTFFQIHPSAEKFVYLSSHSLLFSTVDSWSGDV